MTYSDFDLESLEKTFGLSQKRISLFEKVEPVEISQWLKETLDKGMQLVFDSEKARSELIVMPILLASRELSDNVFAIYSGKRLDVDRDKGLVGECDFILTLTPPLPTIHAPIVTLIEAKKNDIDEGLGQCAAQMLGARFFNQNEKSDIETIFGCVSTGEIWQFLKLFASDLYIDRNRYYIDNPGKVLGILQAIIDHYC